MTDEEIEKWRNSPSKFFVDRKNRPVLNKDVEKMLGDIEYRTVAKDNIKIGDSNILISTVFLGIPHQESMLSDKKVLYETMIFGGKYDSWQHRWENSAIATKAHEKIVKSLKSGEDLPFENTDIISKFLQDMKDSDNEGEEWKNT